MRMRLLVMGVMALGVALFSLAEQSSAQVKKGQTRPLSTKHLMTGLVKPGTTAVAEALKGNGPADDAAWDKLIEQASLLNESAHVMMADGRSPDQVWADACKMLEKGGADLVAKAQARDLAGAREAVKLVTSSCGSCHKAHKK